MGRTKTLCLKSKLKLLKDYQQNGDKIPILSKRYSIQPNQVLRIIRSSKSSAEKDVDNVSKSIDNRQTKTDCKRSKISSNQSSKNNKQSLKKPNSNGKSGNSLINLNNNLENDELNERIQAFRRLFLHCEQIKSIIQQYGCNYNESFEFVRNLNQLTIPYLYLLQELENNRLSSIEPNDIDSNNRINDNNRALEEFRNLIRQGIERVLK